MHSLQLELSKIPIFSKIDLTLSDELGECATIVKKSPNEDIITEGDFVPGIFIITTGEVGIYTGEKNHKIGTIKEGEAFGEMSLIEETTASATIRATIPTEMILVIGRRLHEKMKLNLKLAFGFYKGAAETLSHKLRKTTSIVSQKMDDINILNEKLKNRPSLICQVGEVKIRIDKLIAKINQNVKTHKDDIYELQNTTLREYAPALPALRKLRGDVEYFSDDWKGELKDFHDSIEILEEALIAIEEFLSKF